MSCNCNYEYKLLVDYTSSTTFETDLNTHGANGWKVVWTYRNSSGNYHALLERKL